MSKEGMDLMIAICHEQAITARSRGAFDRACCYDSIADAAERMVDPRSEAVSYKPENAESGE